MPDYRMRPIFLIGYMASGKTTLGRALATACADRHFVDLDEAVEAVAGRSVADIFATDGEAAFRALESEVLRQVGRSGAIVACGGGTPCRPENMDWMLEAGTVVHLVTDTDTTVRRLLLAPGQRPLVDALLDDEAALRRRVEDMQRARAQYYGRAHHTFDSTELESADQIAASVAAFRRQFNI